MNTIRSVYYGWATLIVAGGGAYYFAKKSINADRAAKAEAEHRKRIAQYELEQAHFNNNNNNKSTPATSTSSSLSPSSPAPSAGAVNPGAQQSVVAELGKKRAVGDAPQPAAEATRDLATPGGEEEGKRNVNVEKSPYEASGVYRPKKGDRFS